MAVCGVETTVPIYTEKIALNTDVNTNHLTSLDSLRGLAALMVAIGHSFIAITFSGVDKLWATPIWLIEPNDAIFAKLVLFVGNGSSAVTVFFVLSGVVLGLSLDRDYSSWQVSYRRFLIKRVFRVYPAHILVLLSVVAILFLFSAINPGTYVDASTWFNWYYRNLPNGENIARNLMLLDVFLNPVTWTLKIEMAVALIFPALHWLSRIASKKVVVNVFLLIGLFILGVLNPASFFFSHLYKFYLGLLIPLYLPMVMSDWRKITQIFTLLFSFLLLLLIPQFVKNIFINQVSTSVGAAIIVMMAMKYPSSLLSKFEIIKKLGQHSYSFYLWHFPVIWFSYYFLNQNAITSGYIQASPLMVAVSVCLLSVLGAYFLSLLSYKLVEKPSIILGRKFAHHI
jgi:peptidoglycan/LPS O-acetylase OafA/YrhL